MRRSTAFVALIGLLCSLWASGLWAATQLNGLAVHNELGNEQFIGALYLQSYSSDRNQILSSDGRKRMELRITADDGITARRFSRMWIEGVAINNSGTVLNEQADNMVAFSNLFKGRLEKNDVITFSLEPGDGVFIAINDVALGTIGSDEFFNVLLRTWIGNVPLSSAYRASLLQAGDVSSDLRRRFESIEPSDSRREELIAWTQPPEPAQPAQTARASEPTPSREAPRPDIGIGLPAVALDIPRPDLRASEPEPEPEPEPQPRPRPQPQPEPAPVVEEEEDDEPMLTAESLRAQQVYFSSLLREIQSRTEYPRRAMQRNQEGEVRVSVVINRAGQIISTEVLEESRFSMLNRAALDAVSAAAPFPEVPSAIGGRQYEFAVPFNFILPD
ncbi:TonB family protein [Marinimicrobium sp. ABcell2]|uniref:TonB family protein n=1 Tax=Marinimicrobium sp. ABcell2 TaxID=3069751 RepID=UPI0027B513B3|nr:TonB family protein [Marinimicrobium sp. ABcell2]MDQ2075062.1 TonB family protein [Marinimicrobium sp. ABcell2]